MDNPVCNIHTVQADRKLAYLIRSPLHCPLYLFSSKEKIGVPEKYNSSRAVEDREYTSPITDGSCCCCSVIRKSLRKGGGSWNLSLRLNHVN